jgi:hypothetical protein
MITEPPLVISRPLVMTQIERVRRKNATYKGFKMMQTDTSFVIKNGHFVGCRDRT